MHRFVLLILVLMAFSCNSLLRTTSKIEESHYALYQQKALVVTRVAGNKVWLVNFTQTRCYFLKGKQYSRKWDTGDTLIIDDNLKDFYHIRFTRNCN
jgi:hypothetical protein